ncbi:MAG: type III-B CRISPR module RAMP protein Cmr6 [Thermodesulfobacteriota bacterium]
MIYPFSKELQKAASSFNNGNFGLWFYKLVPLDDGKDFKACKPRTGDKDDKDKDVVSFYRETYYTLKKGNVLKKMLDKKHHDQKSFCRIHEDNGAKVIDVRAVLQSPLITGIGKTHPNEVGMTFDHNMGIPYLPANGIKGLVRLAHILNLIADKEKADVLINEDELDDNHPDSLIPEIFGGDLKNDMVSEKLCGKAVFLDAYPEKIPDLHADIMNPHYGKYYSDDLHQTPPADYLDPVPVQFLTVGKGEVFVFRAIVYGSEILHEPLVKAFHKALMDQGFGAKTAVGYGRFKVIGNAGIQNGMDAETSAAESVPKNEPLKMALSEKPLTEIWQKVVLLYAPNTKTFTTRWEGKNGSTRDESIIPSRLIEKLIKKKKAAAAKVKVELIGGKEYRIVEIFD